VDPRKDLLELSLLYDTARGFLGLRGREPILTTALLSLMGASGASFAVFFERDSDDRLTLRAAQGLSEVPEVSLPLTRRMEKTLGESVDPLCGEEIAGLGPRVARLARGLEIELVCPVRLEGRVRGFFALGPKLLGEPFAGRDVPVVREIVGQSVLALGTSFGADVGATERDRDPAARILSLRKEHPILTTIRGEGDRTASLFAEVVAVAKLDLPVLILGETGTGKELVAHAVHELSHRRAESFEAISCAAIPQDLMASALFGHEKGAFTGADSTVRGAFERSGDGTIFLDEIGDMPLDTQAMLLRVLEERGFRRVGGSRMIPATARVISATNRDLVREVEAERFRADLFYRLQMYTVKIHPLRERREEIPAIAEHVLEGYRSTVSSELRMTPGFVEVLSTRDLRGNVRELESLIAGAIVRSRGGPELRPEHIPDGPEIASGSTSEADGPAPPGRGRGADLDSVLGADGRGVPSYASMERDYIRSVLQLTEGNKREAARLMGIPRTTLNSKIKRFGI
jgi:DNA-binding NtrC family response regulator